jgi:hypothetical protein
VYHFPLAARSRKVLGFSHWTRCGPHRGHMQRRAFIILLGGTAVAWPLAARTQQQPGKLKTIGFFSPNTSLAASPWTTAFVQQLRDLGWIEGRTVTIAYRWAKTLLTRADEVIELNGASSSRFSAVRCRKSL